MTFLISTLTGKPSFQMKECTLKMMMKLLLSTFQNALLPKQNESNTEI